MRECRPDLIVIHGDRVEALAGASGGALNDVLVAHNEGGELSGTVDEFIRRSYTGQTSSKESGKDIQPFPKDFRNA